jgi:hypothetical protein
VTTPISTRAFPSIRSLATSAGAAGLLALAASCANVHPTHTITPRAAAEPAPIPAARTETGALALPLSGDYIATFKAPVLGEVSGRFTARPTGTGFEAWTRQGVAWDMIGGLESIFGPIFVHSLFPDGSILTWTSSLPDGGKPGEGALGPGQVSYAQAHTRITSASAPVDLLTPDGRRVAAMTLRAAASDESSAPPAPAADYPALANGVEAAIRERLFDRSLVSSNQVRSFIHHLKSNSREARDDIEFIFGAVVAARAHVSFALPLVFKALDPDWKSQVSALADNGLATYKVTYDAPTGVATCKFDVFLTATEVDRAFRQVLSYRPRSILIDLRGCPGVTLASLRVVSWLIDEPVDAGAFFDADHRDLAKRGRAGDLPQLVLDSPAAADGIEQFLDARGAARILISPERDHFGGPVAVLTTGRSTTSSEPLAWTLKAASLSAPPTPGQPPAPPRDRIRLFGQSTAGRPTLSRPIDIGQGWVVWLPTLDYLPPAPLSKDRTDRGCRPHFEDASKEKAKLAAMQWLGETGG